MAKSQLEIVLLDEGNRPPDVSAESAAQATATAPVAPRATPQRQERREDSQATDPRRPAQPRQETPQRQRETSASEARDAAIHATEAAARALGLTGLTTSLTHLVDVLRDLRIIWAALAGFQAYRQLGKGEDVRVSQPAEKTDIKTEIVQPPRVNPKDDFEDAEFEVKPTAVEGLPRLGHESTTGLSTRVNNLVGAPAEQQPRGLGAPATSRVVSSSVTTAESAAIPAAESAPVAAAASMLGPLALAAVAVTAAFVGVVVGAKKLADALSTQVQKLEGFSGAVSSATAETELRRERALFDRAERIGPQLAQFERSRGRAEERFSELGTKIYEVLLAIWTALEPFINKAISALEAIVATLEAMFELLRLIYDVILIRDPTEATQRFLNAAAKMAKEIKEVFTGEAGQRNDPVDTFLNDFLNSDGPPRPPARRPAEPHGGFGQ